MPNTQNENNIVKQKQVFISWSGELSRKFAEKLNEFLINTFNNDKINFVSFEIEEGEIWAEKINNALKNCCVGIFLLTHDNYNSSWINFELGAMKYSGNKAIHIINVNVPEKIFNKHLARTFIQCSLGFNADSYEKLVVSIERNTNLSRINVFNVYFDNVRKEIDKLNNDNLQFDLVEEYIINNAIPTYNNPESDFWADVNEIDFLHIRKNLIYEAKGTITIIGQSLHLAFAFNEGIDFFFDKLEERVKNGDLDNINILLTDPILFKETRNRDEVPDSPLVRINKTMIQIIELIKVCLEKNCKLNLYFLPLLQIDHVIISNNYMLYRSTKLWTKKGDYKGAYCVYRIKKQEKKEKYASEIKVHEEWLKAIIDNCTRINLKIDIDKEDNKREECFSIHQKWRRNIKRVIEEQNRYKDIQDAPINLYKLYQDQIVNYIKEDWFSIDPDDNTLRNKFTSSETIHSSDDLFNMENLLNDDTQKVLLPYIKKTEELFNKVLKKYNKFAEAKIYPSLDLGVPNNIQRLAGGFATGMFVVWRCGTAIVPIDATVNVCSSSIFKLENKDVTKITSDFYSLINKIENQLNNDRGFSFNLRSGNHFLMIAEDKKTGCKYIVIHSSAREFKDSYLGLYPVENNWYYKNIKEYYDKSVGRYFRYIKDEEAKLFINTAHRLEGYNEEIHRCLANSIAQETGGIDEEDGSRHTFHHYYMPTDNSIAIGTYVEKPGTVVPIFSNIGKPICKFKVGEDNWKIDINGEKRCLIPHGWGQEIYGLNKIYIKSDNPHKIIINQEEFEISSKTRMETPFLTIRNYESMKDFLTIGGKMISGEIVQILHPIAVYTREK